MIFKRYIQILRSIDAVKTYDARSRINGRHVEFTFTLDGRRFLQIQLWEDFEVNKVVGRVSHNFKGCGDTRPTAFRTPFGMLSAILEETKRTDGKYFEVGSLPSEKEQNDKN